MGVIAAREWRRLPRPMLARSSGTVGSRGMGQDIGAALSVISGIVGPLATAGATAYTTYAQSQLQNKQLNQRKAEVGAVLAANDQQAKADAAAQADQQKKVAQQAQTQGKSDTFRLAFGAGALVLALGVAAWGFSARNRKLAVRNPLAFRQRGRSVAVRNPFVFRRRRRARGR